MTVYFVFLYLSLPFPDIFNGLHRSSPSTFPPLFPTPSLHSSRHSPFLSPLSALPRFSVFSSFPLSSPSPSPFFPLSSSALSLSFLSPSSVSLSQRSKKREKDYSVCGSARRRGSGGNKSVFKVAEGGFISNFLTEAEREGIKSYRIPLFCFMHLFCRRGSSCLCSIFRSLSLIFLLLFCYLSISFLVLAS